MDEGFLRNISSLVTKPTPVNGYSSSITVRTLPLIGRVHIVHDTGGIMQVGFVFAYWVYGTFTSLFIILLPQYYDEQIPSCVVIGYMVISIMCLLSLVKASITNPGRIPLNGEVDGLDTSEWVFCKTCDRKRPPRAHHCRRCQQCVLRMDHHCPWINNCVGEENHFSFMLLLLYAFLLGASSFVLCMLHFWVFPKCRSCDREAFYIKHSIWLVYLLVVLAINMAVVMLLQLGNQHFNLLSDRTTLENMQSPYMPAEGPKLRTTYLAYRELCGRGSILCWLWPCRQRSPALLTNKSSEV